MSRVSTSLECMCSGMLSVARMLPLGSSRTQPLCMLRNCADLVPYFSAASYTVVVENPAADAVDCLFQLWIGIHRAFIRNTNWHSWIL